MRKFKTQKAIPIASFVMYAFALFTILYLNYLLNNIEEVVGGWNEGRGYENVLGIDINSNN